MITLDIKKVKNAKLVRVNKQSVVLEIEPNEHVYCHRNIFNQITAADEELPCFAVEHESFNGKSGQFTKTLWVAIPKAF